MDGASKFIRGDAIAGILITLINIVGGIIIGVVQNGLDLSTALENYTVLTIGDGLVGQIPALVISAAAGMLVTRVPDNDSQGLHGQFGSQLFSSPRALMMLSASLFLFVFIPGLRLPFFILGGIVGIAAWQNRHNDSYIGGSGTEGKPAVGADGQAVDASGAAEESDEETTLEGLMTVEAIAIELGVDLIQLVDESKGGNLVERISRIRRQMVQDLGLIVPSVHLRDNLRLDGGEYRVVLRGEEVGRGRVVPRQHLAINPGDAEPNLSGLKCIDPVFGLEALWITDKNKLDAQAKGYRGRCSHGSHDTPDRDSPAVRSRALQSQPAPQHARASRRENPQLVEELIPDQLPRSSVLRVFRNLLREGVSVETAPRSWRLSPSMRPGIKDANSLTEFVRQRLARHLTHRYATADNVLNYIALAPDTEEVIARSAHLRVRLDEPRARS